MPPWWEQAHRLVTGSGASWLCTCGAKGRSKAGELDDLAKFNNHVDRMIKAHERLVASRRGKRQHEWAGMRLRKFNGRWVPG